MICTDKGVYDNVCQFSPMPIQDLIRFDHARSRHWPTLYCSSWYFYFLTLINIHSRCMMHERHHSNLPQHLLPKLSISISSLHCAVLGVVLIGLERRIAPILQSGLEGKETCSNWILLMSCLSLHLACESALTACWTTPRTKHQPFPDRRSSHCEVQTRKKVQFITLSNISTMNSVKCVFCGMQFSVMDSVTVAGIP